MKTSFNRFALIGAVLSLPAALIMIPGLAQGLFGRHQLNDALDALFVKATVFKVIIHPIVVIGGLLVAVGLSALPVFKFTFVPEDGTLIGVLRTKDRGPNLIMFLLAGFLLASLFAYSITENFVLVAR